MSFGELVPDTETSVFAAVHGFSFGPTGDDDGSWFGSFEVTDAERQPYGVVHGGMYAALAENVASMGTAVAVLADGDIALGQSNNTTFLRPSFEGTIEALAIPLHRGRTSWVWTVDMSNAGKRVAHSIVTLAVRPKPS